MHITRRLRLLGAGLALSLPLLMVVPLAASPALADVAPPSGCTEITDNNGVSGFGLHDNGHNVQATTTRAAQCWQFLNPIVLGGHTWYQLEDTKAGLCLDDVKEADYPESCPLDDHNELWRIVGSGNNMLQNEASGHYLNAASISNNAVVGSTPNSSPQSTNTWTFTAESPVFQTLPVLFAAYPGYNSPYWSTLEQSEPYGEVSHVVLEICDTNGNCGGNAQSKNTNWDSTLTGLVSAGITPLYYIDTAFGADSLSSVETAVSNAMTWYGSDGIGIMFDEVNPTGESTSCNGAANCYDYYQDLYNYVSTTESNKHTIFFNVGSPPDENYTAFGSQAIIQVFENTYANWTTYSTIEPSWEKTCDCGKQLAATVTGATSAQYQNAQNLADGLPIDNFYVTDETDGAYDVLPSYFANETAYGAHFTS
jgi:hypothetical protein